jgi:hypothetical protein
MATTKVSALAETTSPQANDELLINQSGVSKKVKITNLPAGLDNTKLPLAGGQMTGNITMSGSQTVDGRDVSADGTQLDTNTSAIATKAPIASPTFTGTVAIPNIANLETAVAANTAKTGITTSQANAITANTAKVTNATHTGDVTGATALTIANDAVTEAKLNLISTASVPSLEAKGTSGVTDGYIQLNCAENSHGIKLKSPPHSANADYTLTFPNDDGAANQKLTTDGSGVLTWTADSTTDSTKLPLAGGTMTGQISFGDNVHAKFGASDDLDIYHDGSSSYIKDAGTGDLILSGANIRISNVADSQNHIRCADGADVKLYYAGNDKLQTTANGVTVTGGAVGTMTTDNDGSFAMSASNNFKCTPTGNFTLTFTSIVAQSGNILLVNSGGHTVSAHANTKVDANLLATVSTAGTYLLSYFSDGTNVYMTNSAIYT